MSEIVDLECAQRERYREFRLEDLSTDAVVDTRSDTDAASVVTRFPTTSAGDWSNKELASIYRALRLLHGAGVAIEAERGVTDDGSPWCVFCNSQGEVLVHIARIDQGYVLDGVGLDGPLRGRTFDELIDRFVGPDRGDGLTDRPAGLSDILDLSRRRDAKLFVHPAAQFAALLWAAMVVKDMVGAQELDAIRDGEEMGAGLLSDGGLAEERSTAHADTKQRLAERPDALTSDMSAKLRDAGHANVMQSAGLMSLAYFLVSAEQMSPGAVLERHVLDLEGGMDDADAALEASSPLAVFEQALQAIGSVLQTMGDIFQAPTSELPSDTSEPEAISTAEATLKLLSQIETMLELQVEAPQGNDPHLAVEAPVAGALQDAPPDDQAPAAAEMALSTFEDILGYIHSVALDMAPRYSPPPAKIIALIDDSKDVATVDNAAVDTDPQLAESARAKDGEVIAAILEFLRLADEELSYYHTAGVHVIEQGDILSGDLGGAQTFAWTFDDGSRIMLVGTAEDLADFGVFA